MNENVRIGILIIFTLTASTAAGGETPELLTLERAIEIALDGNHQLRASEARLGAAAAAVAEAESLRLPRLDLDGSYQRTDNPVLVFSNLLGQARFGAENFALASLNEPEPLDNWKARLELSQPLWTGGRIRGGVEVAGLERDAAESDRETARQRTVHQVIESYTGAVLARRELHVTHESLATARAHVELVSDLHRGGLVVESDRLQAEVRESEVRELTLRAEKRAEVAVATLNLALGRGLDTPVALPEGLTPGAETAGVEPDLDELVERAWSRRPDLAAARSRLAANERQRRVERAARRPEVGLGASYEMNAEDFFGIDGDNWAVTVGLSFDVFDGHRTRARVRRAEHRIREAEALSELMAQSISLEVRQAYFERRAARQRLEQAQKGVALGERSLEMIEDRYREGLTTLPELLDAETALTRSRLRRISAERDLLLAHATLDLATGDL